MYLDKILYLDAATVSQLLLGQPILDIVEHAFAMRAQGLTVLPDEAYLRWSTQTNTARSLVLPAALGSPAEVAGVKLINSSSSNLAQGLDRASGLTLLFDVLSGAVNTIMAGAEISAVRTAAVSVLAIRYLSPLIVRRVVIIGCGPIGLAHARLMLRTFDCLESLILFDLTDARAEAAKSELADEFKLIDVQRATSLDEALSQPAAIAACTSTTTPYIGLSQVQPGSVVVNVGLDDCAKSLLVGADLLLVDDLRLVQLDEHRLLGHLLRDGAVSVAINGGRTCRSSASIDGELPDVFSGRLKFDISPIARVVINPFGLGISDIAIANAIAIDARSKGQGRLLER